MPELEIADARTLTSPAGPPASDPPPNSSEVPIPPRPARRPRYAGKNPRNFAEKYKELDPVRYAADVAKVVASGKTPAGSHRPIMVDEILTALQVRPGSVVVDCTLGYGGHASALLERIAPDGRLIGVDVDPIEHAKTTERLRAAGWSENTFTPVRSNFAGLPSALARLGLSSVDAILADLGISSMQLDDPSRGFSYKTDSPLDLRLNPSRPPSAADWLSRVTVPQLTAALINHSDEPHAALLGPELVQRQKATPFTRTRQLADAVRDILRSQPRTPDPDADETSVRRVFQALRIAVNDEFGVLDLFLRQLPDCLKPGGRVAILTFHSGEDRRVKHAFHDGVRSGLYKTTNDEVIRAGPAERYANPRSTSAKLRWAIRA